LKRYPNLSLGECDGEEEGHDGRRDEVQGRDGRKLEAAALATKQKEPRKKK
jgi:hypothetical protein